MKYIVYQTTNLKNNKIYIGVHKTLDPNIFDGYIGCGVIITSPSSYNNPYTPLQYAVKKYGTANFKRVVLKTFETLEEAYKLEAELVDHDFIKRKDTYNVKLGGIGGSSYFVKINQFDINGKYLKTWNSIVEAAEFYSISDSAINNANKFKGSCVGFFWSTEDTINIKEYSYYTGQICYKYNNDGKFEEMYNSLVEASKDNNVPLQSIQRAVKGGYCVEGSYYSTELHDSYLGKPKISLKNTPIYIYTLKGDYITTLRNSSEIYNFFNIKSTSSITTAIRTGRQYRDYQISLEYKDKLEEVIDLRNKKKAVIQYTLTGDFIKEFDSITQAVSEYGTGVQKVVKGQQKQCKGFIFRYK